MGQPVQGCNRTKRFPKILRYDHGPGGGCGFQPTVGHEFLVLCVGEVPAGTPWKDTAALLNEMGLPQFTQAAYPVAPTAGPGASGLHIPKGIIERLVSTGVLNRDDRATLRELLAEAADLSPVIAELDGQLRQQGLPVDEPETALEARCRALELQLAEAQANAADQRAMKAKAREQRNAVTAELDELRRDKVRLDFIERQPGMSLRNHKKGKLWIFGGFSNYEQTFYPSLRMAIDATMEGRE